MANIISRLIDLTIQIQQIPAPTFQEKKRAAFVHALFEKEDMGHVETDAHGNVLAHLPANQNLAHPPNNNPVIVSAHLDTVFPDSTDLNYRQEEEKLYGPGIGDNSVAVAGLFGLLWSIQERKIELSSDLWLIANVGEEGLGNLCGMKGIVDRFVGTARAYLVLEGMSLGSIYHRGLGVRRYRIQIHTEGGHSWLDQGHPSAIHELTRLSTQLTQLELSQNPRTTLNIGRISGGTSVNTIAPEASIEIDLRSENVDKLEELASQVLLTSQRFKQRDVKVTIEEIGARPAGGIPASHSLVLLAEKALRSQGLAPRLNIGSTDANIPLSRGFPAVTLGLTTGGRAHTVYEYIDLQPLEKGLESILELVKTLQ